MAVSGVWCVTLDSTPPPPVTLRLYASARKPSLLRGLKADNTLFCSVGGMYLVGFSCIDTARPILGGASLHHPKRGGVGDGQVGAGNSMRISGQMARPGRD